MAKLGDHPGFKAVQEHIATASNMPMEAAGAVLANASRNAGPAAKKKNPRLNRVGGSKNPGTKPSMSGGSPSTDISGMFGGDKGSWK
jgi:hypothetical protein